MRRILSVVFVTAFAAGWWTPAAHSQDHQHGDHSAAPHRHPAAVTLTHPVPVDVASLSEGRQLYAKRCATCHGVSGTGGVALDPKPSDLTDRFWKHGSSESEIFTLIRDGAKQTAMRGFGGKRNTRELWSIVNYLRSLGPKPTPFH